MAIQLPRSVIVVDQESDRSTSWTEGTVVYAIAERTLQILKDGAFQDFSNTGGSGASQSKVAARVVGGV
jgi:hypothetical protein